jgi:hypothetical protein
MRDTIDMAREAGIIDSRDAYSEQHVQAVLQELEAFEALVRADEREQALAAPVAWRTRRNGTWSYHANEPHGVFSEPVYTTPPAAQRQWTGLTNQELIDLTSIYSGAPLYCAIEAKLKEKNI